MIQTKPRPIDTIMGPFLRFARLEASGGILLLFATAAALIWANSPWEATYHFAVRSSGKWSIQRNKRFWQGGWCPAVFETRPARAGTVTSDSSGETGQHLRLVNLNLVRVDEVLNLVVTL